MNINNSTSPNFQALRIKMIDPKEKKAFIESATPEIRSRLTTAAEKLKNTKFVDLVMNASERENVYFEPVIRLKKDIKIVNGLI